MAYAICEFDAQDESGNLLSNVTVELRREGGGLQVAYSDREGTVALGSTWLVTDGKVQFFAPGGAYKITLTNGALTRVRRYVAIGTAAEQDIEQNVSPGYFFEFGVGTTAPPLDGSIRANNANLSLATHLYVSKLNLAGSDVSARFLELDSTGKSTPNQIILTAVQVTTQASYNVATATDMGDYIDLVVSDHSGSTSFSTNTVSALPIITGQDADIAGGVLTTLGDLLYRGVSTTARLGIGATNAVLTVVGGLPVWQGLATAAEVLSGTAGKLFDAATSESAMAWKTLTDGTTITVNHNNGRRFTVTTASARTISASNLKDGQQVIIVFTGNHLHTWSSTYFDFTEVGGVPVAVWAIYRVAGTVRNGKVRVYAVVESAA